MICDRLFIFTAFSDLSLIPHKHTHYFTMESRALRDQYFLDITHQNAYSNTPLATYYTAYIYIYLFVHKKYHQEQYITSLTSQQTQSQRTRTIQTNIKKLFQKHINVISSHHQNIIPYGPFPKDRTDHRSACFLVLLVNQKHDTKPLSHKSFAAPRTASLSLSLGWMGVSVLWSNSDIPIIHSIYTALNVVKSLVNGHTPSFSRQTIYFFQAFGENR